MHRTHGLHDFGIVMGTTGTTLAAMLKLTFVPACGGCRKLRDEMNSWGPDGCAERLETILDRLAEHAQRAKFPFNRTVAARVVRLAIWYSRSGRTPPKLPDNIVPKLMRTKARVKAAKAVDDRPWQQERLQRRAESVEPTAEQAAAWQRERVARRVANPP